MATDPKSIDSRTPALFALAIVMMVAMVVAWRVDAVATSSPPEDVYQLSVLNERGAPIPGASVEYGGRTAITDGGGIVALKLRSPELVLVHAIGLLSDAVVVGSPDRPETTLRLLADTGPNGPRTVMHFAGDFMMGRRYVEGDEDTEPLVTDEETARGIVDDIAPLFALADLSTVNYESVIGTLSYADAYAGKRYLLQSPPATVVALDELGVDLVTLGNNHVNDWLDSGVASTTRYLNEAGVAFTGAGTNAADAAQPAIVSAGDLRVGVVSMTTVTGDYVNDNLPNATAPVPATIADADRWQYEQREFGFGASDEQAYVEPALRRPGPMWELFDAVDNELPVADAADLWLEITRIYPELQDWVARRGHGGAAQYSKAAVTDAVAAARSGGADLVVVQLHGGFQFAEVSSDFFGKATRAAVDAGADLVIGHHPHILQGFEIYEDTLIAYSLGNFVFDQDFLSTHTSVVLRTVFEDNKLIATTLYPVIIEGYRPIAASGEIADQILRQVNEASLQDAVSLRLPDLRIGSSRTAAPVTAAVVNDQGRGTVVPMTGAESLPVSLVANTPTAIGTSLIQIDDASSGLLLGRDVFGYGTLEDLQADGRESGAVEWSIPPDSLEIDLASPAGPWTVRLDRTSQHLSDIVARTAARVSLPAHRWFDEDGQPTDGESTHTIQVWAKRVGAGIPFVRVIFYEFDDTDPTRVPESTPLQTVDVQLPLVNDGAWHQLSVDMPDIPTGANTALVGVGLSPPQSQSGTVWVDGLEVIEWRFADEIPRGTWVPADYVQSTREETATLTVQ
jgi:poly-gamma-glutamate capsule biosynthesis protein CapA/YwtB (metallophosphatase superfamily)